MLVVLRLIREERQLEKLRIDFNEEKSTFDEFPIYQIDISSCNALIFKKIKFMDN